MVSMMKILDRFRQKDEIAETETLLTESFANESPGETVEDVYASASANRQTEPSAAAEGGTGVESECTPDDTVDRDVRIADERCEALRSELAAARDEMRRRELEYFALSLLAEEKMSPKLCTMVQGETEEDISRNVEAIRAAVREEVQRLRGSGDRTPPAAGKSSVSSYAIKKLSLRELKGIMV